VQINVTAEAKEAIEAVLEEMDAPMMHIAHAHRSEDDSELLVLQACDELSSGDSLHKVDGLQFALDHISAGLDQIDIDYQDFQFVLTCKPELLPDGE
jgi:Fe-S cluster assembly iron-binding protein IscA